jgi:hypothetical protein
MQSSTKSSLSTLPNLARASPRRARDRAPPCWCRGMSRCERLAALPLTLSDGTRTYESGTETWLGTDALNASPYPPFLTLWYTISGKTQLPGQPGVAPEQRLTRMEALEMATRKCGWFMDLEEKIGALEVGKRADLIVLDRDYFKVPVDDIRTLTSVLTVVDGDIVHADGKFAGLAGWATRRTGGAAPTEGGGATPPRRRVRPYTPRGRRPS